MSIVTTFTYLSSNNYSEINRCMIRINPDLITLSAVPFHAHAIKQIDKSYAFRICIVLGYAQQYWFENQQKKTQKLHALYPFNWTHWINKEQNYMYYVLNILWQASLQNPILIWWQQIILILVGQIKEKSVSFRQLLLGKLNIKYVTISVSHQPTSQIKQNIKHQISVA